MRERVIELCLKSGVFIEKDGKIYDVKKLEESKTPNSKYTGEVVAIKIDFSTIGIGYGIKMDLEELICTPSTSMTARTHKCPCGDGTIVDFTGDCCIESLMTTCKKCNEKYHFEFSQGGSKDLVVVEKDSIITSS